MKESRPPNKRISLDLAEFLHKLMARGHVTEKIAIFLAFGFLCFTVGAFYGKFILESKPNYKVSACEEGQAGMASREPQSNERRAVSGKLTGSLNAVSHLAEDYFYSIRIYSSELREDAVEVTAANQEICKDIEYEYSSTHAKYMVYCGKFDAYSLAVKQAKDIGATGKVIVRRYPDEG